MRTEGKAEVEVFEKFFHSCCRDLPSSIALAKDEDSLHTTGY